MKTIRTDGISWLAPVLGGTSEWYCAISRKQGDLYEAEEIFRSGRPLEGNRLCLIHYPEGTVYRPVSPKVGTYLDTPVYLEESIYFLQVDFNEKVIRILRFACGSKKTDVFQELPLASVKNCYNLQLQTSPLTLTRQGDEDLFEIIWPERTSFALAPHESFFLRAEDRLFFNKWHEEGEDASYRYWEETVVRDLTGNLVEVLQGDVCVMPNGELWHLL